MDKKIKELHKGIIKHNKKRRLMNHRKIWNPKEMSNNNQMNKILIIGGIHIQIGIQHPSLLQHFVFLAKCMCIEILTI